MIQSSYTVRILQPAEGHLLTQSDDTTRLEDRIFSDKVFLGVNDSPSNWKEIALNEADVMKAEKAKLAEQHNIEMMKGK